MLTTCAAFLAIQLNTIIIVPIFANTILREALSIRSFGIRTTYTILFRLNTCLTFKMAFLLYKKLILEQFSFSS